MKKNMKYWWIVALVLIGAALFLTGNAQAVIVDQQPAVITIGGTVIVTPNAGLVARPNPVILTEQPQVVIVRPFFGNFNPFFNPFFFNVDEEAAFIGAGFNEGFVEED